MVSIFSNEIFLRYVFFFDIMLFTLNGPQYSVNITYMFGNQKVHVTCFVLTFALLWWLGTKYL